MNDILQDMKCPNDDTTLIMSERQNIEIDYCPTCRGVWLDRGELDKMIERSTENTAKPEPRAQQEPTYQAPRQEYREQKYDSYHQSGQYKKKKKESFLSDLFEF